MLSIGERRIDCVEAGAGPALLFLPGSYSTTAAWRPIQKLLPPGRRMVTTSLCGYGGSTDTRNHGDFGMAHELQLVLDLAAHIGRPLHLVGHSFGGTVALAAALSGRVQVLSLSLFEANPMGLVRSLQEGRIYQDTLHMSQAFESAVAAGERDAPGRIIDFWGNAGAYAAMPEQVKAYCRETATVNVLDWRTAMGWEVDAPDCAALQVPVLLVRGGDANPAMVGITDALRGCLRDARHHVVEGAGHFLISSHPTPCATLLARFLDEVAPVPAP